MSTVANVSASTVTVSNSITGFAGRDTTIPLTIPYDLAVQLIGSDAGKAKRIKPHGSMTKKLAKN